MASGTVADASFSSIIELADGKANFINHPNCVVPTDAAPLLAQRQDANIIQTQCTAATIQSRTRPHKREHSTKVRYSDTAKECHAAICHQCTSH